VIVDIANPRQQASAAQRQAFARPIHLALCDRKQIGDPLINLFF